MSSTSEQQKSLIKSLKTFSFRNINSLSIELHPKNNLFIGHNGQGKTNCLEAICQAISLRTLQSLKNEDLINRGCEKSKVEASIGGELDLDISIEIFKAGKKAWINKKAISNAKGLSEKFSVVSFIPNELNMINGSPSLRRLAIDQAALSLFPTHGLSLRAYERALANRNSCLKNTWPLDKDVFNAFTKVLIEKSESVTISRLNAIRAIKPFFKANIKNILNKNTEADINYHLHSCEKTDNSEIANKLSEVARRLEKEEILRKTTLIGCHLDDVEFTLNGMCAQKRASRGECRSLVFALKIGQMQAISDMLMRAPFVILDDLPSELDKDRLEGMMACISKLAGQTFYSAVDPHFFTLDSCKIFEVNSGIITS